LYEYSCNNPILLCNLLTYWQLYLLCNIKRLLHDIFHIGPGINPRLPYQARQWSWRADMGRRWYQERYGKFHVIIFLSHILHWPFPSIEFYIAKKIFELTNCENKSLRELPLFNIESGFKNIPNNVDLYNDVRNCL
jgi:hypothetical protein